jgi:molybdopterin/thiamine biosynthesis adenylyltransferase
MISRIFSDKRSAFFAACLVLAAPAAAVAQDAAAEAIAPSTLVLTTADGAETQYQVNDVSVYLSSNPAYDDVPASTSLSVSLTTITPVDAALLQWAAQTTTDTRELRNVKVTTSVTNPDGKQSDLVYDVTDAHVGSLSATNSVTAVPSISLTLDASALSINGVPMN